MRAGSRWRGLRVRVAFLTILVAGASVAAMAWYASRVSVSAWRRQLQPTPPALLEQIAREVAGAVGPGQADWRRAQQALTHGAAKTGKQLIVFDSTRRAVAAAPPELMRLDVTLGLDGAVAWQRTVAAPPPDSGFARRAIVRQRVIVGSPGGIPIRRPPGTTRATLVEIATPLSLDDASEPPIVSALRRSLLVGLAVAIAGAIIVSLLLSARVAAPIERLTQAARTLGSRSHVSPPAPVPEEGTAEVAELSRAFNGMAAELARQESLRRGMTSDIAHELRTPLTNMRCQIESLIDGLVKPTPEVLASLHEESLGLQRLIDDLQDMAYGDQGRLALDVQPLAVAPELHAAVRPFQQRAVGAGTSLSVNATPGLPPIAADPRRFRQIVANLVTNALTHSSGRSVTVTARRAEDAVEFDVTDTGAGIPASDLPNVFERFYRADPARARAGGGAGLGLAIVKQLVELQGGRVSLASTVGRGTSVRFTLPVA
jgi:signal transduction histidine kinase